MECGLKVNAHFSVAMYKETHKGKKRGIQGVSKKVSPLKLFAIFSLRLSLFVRNNLYPHNLPIFVHLS